MARLPSVETQTVAFYETCRKLGLRDSLWLKWRGFQVYLRYYREFTLLNGEKVGEVLVIANIQIPRGFRRRGWFWRYCQLCSALALDGVFIESVNNRALADALRRRPEFREYGDGHFLLRRHRWDEWPLSLRPDPRVYPESYGSGPSILPIQLRKRL